VISTSRRFVDIAPRLAHDAAQIVIDSPANGRPRSLRRTADELVTYARAVWSARGGTVAAAEARAERLLQAHPDLWGALLIRAASESRHGEPSAALATIRRVRAIGATEFARSLEAEFAARLEETDPAWLPEIPGPSTRIEPRDPDVVMHLLKVSLPDRQSGYTIRSREVLRAQVRAGLEPFVVTPFGYPPAGIGRVVRSPETVDGIRHFRLGPGASLEGVWGPALLSRTAELARDIVISERPAIIHVASGHRGYELALVAAALRQRLGVPMVYEVRGLLEESWTNDPAIAPTAADAELTHRRRAQEDRMMALADGVTTLGTAMRDELVARGVSEDKIVVVPNGIDPEAFHPAAPDPELRRRYGLQDRWVFGYISNMDHFREGQALLIEAAARLIAAGRRVACLLVGDGTLRPQLEALAARAGVRDAVVFTGRVPHDQVAAHYALLDAFVVPRAVDRAARFVTPLKPFEAMAMGVPLVVSDLPALTEIAAPDGRGLAFAAGDAAALQSVLERLMDELDLGAGLRAAARSWVLAERTWAANGPRYRHLYDRILERGPAAVSSSGSR
jgi:glycosyltransferase involved in cell wall biosynthesis